MNNPVSIKTIKSLLIILIILTAICALSGLIFQKVYEDWMRPMRAWESRGQDLVSFVFALPLLFIAYRMIRKNSFPGFLIAAGILGYLIYIYMIYAFGGVYSLVFPLYLSIIGLSIFSLIGILNELPSINKAVKLPRIIVAVFFFFTALLLSIIWGSEVLKAIFSKTLPEANVIYVIDLCFVIPLFILSGLWLLQRKDWGAACSGIMLIKASTLGLSITIGQSLAFLNKTMEELFLAGFFLVFSAAAIILTVRFYRKLGM